MKFKFKPGVRRNPLPLKKYRLLKPKFIGRTPGGSEWWARFSGEEAILRERLAALWAKHNSKSRSNPGKPYQGHESWNAWNVSLWISNEEPLYRAAIEAIRKSKGARGATMRFLHENGLEGTKTPDGATYSWRSTYLAIKGLMDDGDAEPRSNPRRKPRHTKIPSNFPVRPLRDGTKCKDRATCGNCGLSWDDGKSTSWTPVPSGRCPFEYFHIHDDNPRRRRR